jgi:threonine dehydrogenase-like Zn-dependent dehydrogenase
VLVVARYSGVSRGTERLVFTGAVPKSEHTRMRAPFQAGELPFPVKYGYASVGTIEAGDESLLGRDVFCLFPHQTAYVVPAAAVIALPDGLAPERAVLAANMETAINATWDAECKVGDRVNVIGAGVLGCLTASLIAQVPGCEVTLVDVDVRKARVAEALGLRFAPPEDAPRERDLVVHASATAEGLSTALASAGVEGRVIELSWFGAQSVTLPLGEAFHAKRLTLRSSQVGRVPQAQAPRWTTRARLKLALRLLRDPRLDVLIDSQGPFAGLPETMKQLATPESAVLCHRVRY